MIITCKSCNTKYSINKNALGKNGKKVKCSNCGYEWYQKLHITKKNLPTKSLEKKQIPRNAIRKNINVTDYFSSESEKKKNTMLKLLDSKEISIEFLVLILLLKIIKSGYLEIQK